MEVGLSGVVLRDQTGCVKVATVELVDFSIRGVFVGN